MSATVEANHPHLTTQKSFYVEISRVRDRAEFFTDDKAAPKGQLEAVTGERIAALEAVESEPAKSVDRDRPPRGKLDRHARHRPLKCG